MLKCVVRWLISWVSFSFCVLLLNFGCVGGRGLIVLVFSCSRLKLKLGFRWFSLL